MKKIILSGLLSLMATTGLTSVAEATTCSISGSIDFAYTGAIETCTVSQAGLYGVTAVGGWQYIYYANAKGDVSLSSGEIISIIVGSEAVNKVSVDGYGYTTGAGGSFVFQGSGSGATPLIVAGGSGGWGYGNAGATASVTTSGTAAGAGGGGGGVNGGNGVNSYGQGGEGYLAILAAPTPANGGVFGGGGNGYASGDGSGGGGGGYSGGGGGGYGVGDNGGGGGSFVVSTATNASIGIISGQTSYGGNGSVDFALINTTASSPPSSVPEPGAIAVFASAIAGLVFARFWLKRRNT